MNPAASCSVRRLVRMRTWRFKAHFESIRWVRAAPRAARSRRGPVGWVVGRHIGTLKSAENLDEEADNIGTAFLRVRGVRCVDPQNVREGASRKQAHVLVFVLDQPVVSELRRELSDLCRAMEHQVSSHMNLWGRRHWYMMPQEQDMGIPFLAFSTASSSSPYPSRSSVTTWMPVAKFGQPRRRMHNLELCARGIGAGDSCCPGPSQHLEALDQLGVAKRGCEVLGIERRFRRLSAAPASCLGHFPLDQLECSTGALLRASRLACRSAGTVRPSGFQWRESAWKLKRLPG